MEFKLTTMLVAALVLASCSAPEGMEPAAPPVGSGAPPPPPEPVLIAGPSDKVTGAVDACLDENACTSVRVFYGTNRAIDPALPIERINSVGNASVTPFAAVESEDGLAYGSVTVSVPCLRGDITTAERGCQRRFAEIPRPSEMGLFGASWRQDLDPYRHFVFYRAEILPETGFADAVSDVEQAFVFIHGFNVSFKRAAMAAAQLKVDSQFPGDAFIFSWPTRHAPDYVASRDAAVEARGHFRDYIEFVLEETNADEIHLVAHSMGNHVIMPVLAEMAAERKTSPELGDGPVFGELIFAAPDVAATDFAAYAEDIEGLGRGLTLYASANDLAMRASIEICRINQIDELCGPRAGDIGPSGPVTLPNVETIDVSSLDGNFFAAGVFDDFGHGYFNEDRNLIQDIGVLMASGVRPPERRNPTLRKVDAETGEYWRFP